MPNVSQPQPRVGIDLVRISRIEESLQRFGDRFVRRLFHKDEIVYAMSAQPARRAERLAARFAAKEAAARRCQKGGARGRPIRCVPQFDSRRRLRCGGRPRAAPGIPSHYRHGSRHLNATAKS